MARSANPIGLSCFRLGLPALALLLGCSSGFAENALPLSALNTRKSIDFSPVQTGKSVIIEGVVSAPAFHFREYSLLPVDDGESGTFVRVSGSQEDRLDASRPGDRIRVSGRVELLGGLPVMAPETIVAAGHSSPPSPLRVALTDLEGFRYLGMLVQTEGRVVRIAEAPEGMYVHLLGGSGGFRILVPHGADEMAADLSRLNPGDRIGVTGVAFQDCVRAPFNRDFELLASSPQMIVRMERSWFIPPVVIGAALMMVVLVMFFIWSREHRLGGQRERLRRAFQLGEEILGSTSTDAILKRLAETLPGILKVTGVRLYIHNRAAKTLDEVGAADLEGRSISLSSPPGGSPAGAVACFHYRTLLAIPDIARSPFPMTAQGSGRDPKSVLLVPMLAQGEVTGVLELDQADRTREFNTYEQALAQHLGNQIGVAIRLLDQRSVQEQLFRTEKLAAVGRLISGVVNELEAPLSSISDLAGRALEQGRLGPAEREIAAIAAAAQTASQMVSRLVSFAGEQAEARPVCINTLLHNLVEFRQGDWKASGIRVRDLTSREPLYVLGSQGQLEQVFLNLLVHAEQTLAPAAEKVLTIRTSVLAKRLSVEIAFTATPGAHGAADIASVLGLSRTILAGHGGEVRLIEKGNADPRFEVELPALARERAVSQAACSTPGDDLRRMTALVIEADEGPQRHLLAMLASRGCRVVPVDNADKALELAQRLRFDLAFCSVHAPGLNWVELSERMHARVAAFVLLSDRYDPELIADFEGDGRFVLAKPVQETELDRVLQSMEIKASMRATG